MERQWRWTRFQRWKYGREGLEKWRIYNEIWKGEGWLEERREC